MNIDFNCDAIIENKQEILAEIFNIEGEQLLELVTNIAKASLTEYIKMLSGSGVPNRADESKQIRLYYLITNHYHKIPDDLEISSLFQSTLTQSKTLIKNTVSRYRVKLKNIIFQTIKNLLEEKYNQINVLYEDRENNEQTLESYILETLNEREKIQFIIKSEFIKLEINNEISKENIELELFQKQKNTMFTYSLHRDTVVALFRRYELGI